MRAWFPDEFRIDASVTVTGTRPLTYFLTCITMPLSRAKRAKQILSTSQGLAVDIP